MVYYIKTNIFGKNLQLNKLFPLKSTLGPAIKVHLILIINSNDNIAYIFYLS